MCDAMSSPIPQTPNDFTESCRLIAHAILSLPASEREAHLTTMRNENPVQASVVRAQMDLIRFEARQIDAEATALVNRLLGMPTAGRLMAMQQLRETQPALHAAVSAAMREVREPARPSVITQSPFPESSEANLRNLLVIMGATPEMLTQAGRFTQERMAEPGPPELPQCLVSAFSDYMRVVEERNRQRVQKGDWVSLTPNNGLFAKLPEHGNRRQGSDMRPGRPLVHTGIVTSVAYEMDNHSGIMQERITMECNGKTYRGRRTMPGATDNDLLLPCALPNCSRPHINGHPFCRDHHNDHPVEYVIDRVSERLNNLRQVREDRSTPPEVKNAVEADMDMLHQFVTDRMSALRRAQQTEARRQRTLQEQARIQALADERKEKELLAQLMAKHGIVAQPKNDPLVEGERNLEL